MMNPLSIIFLSSWMEGHLLPVNNDLDVFTRTKLVSLEIQNPEIIL